MECIIKDSLTELFDYVKKMREFQLTHNQFVNDVGKLLEICHRSEDDLKVIMIRVIYKEFFSMVEADLYLINQFNPYVGFDDLHRTVTKFKKTYRQHALSFKKANLQEKYQSVEFLHFLRALEKRHGFTHPKSRASLTINPEDLTLIHRIFEAYRLHVNALMTNVGMAAQIPFKTFF